MYFYLALKPMLFILKSNLNCTHMNSLWDCLDYLTHGGLVGICLLTWYAAGTCVYDCRSTSSAQIIFILTYSCYFQSCLSDQLQSTNIVLRLPYKIMAISIEKALEAKRNTSYHIAPKYCFGECTHEGEQNISGAGGFLKVGADGSRYCTALLLVLQRNIKCSWW